MINFKEYLMESSDYRGQHTAPSSDGGAPLHKLNDDIYPDDIYSNKAARYYGDGSIFDNQSISLIHSFRGKPNKMVTIYRAVPNEAPNEITDGDWVTINMNYAKQHGKMVLKGQQKFDYKIISKKVPARTVWTDGNSIHEFGYNA